MPWPEPWASLESEAWWLRRPLPIMAPRWQPWPPAMQRRSKVPWQAGTKCPETNSNKHDRSLLPRVLWLPD